jgi:hypothetical protein
VSCSFSISTPKTLFQIPSIPNIADNPEAIHFIADMLEE